jgi:hypothetical protein
MARMMESREAMRDETARSLPTSDQFYTKSCARCAGLLVNEWDYDLNNTGEHSVETLRCVQCGHRVDLVILQNQIRPLVENQQVRQVRQRYSTRTSC